MVPLLALLSLLSLNALKPVAAAAGEPAYYGCLSSSFAPTNYETIDGMASATDCANQCYTNYETTYAYYQPYQDVVKRSIFKNEKTIRTLNRRITSGTCFCSDDPATYAEFETSQATDGTGTCANDAYQAYITTSTFSFDGCYESYNPSADESDFTLINQGQPLASPEACLQACDGYTRAIFGVVNEESSAGYGCYCGDSNFYGVEADACTVNNAFFYSHTAGTAVNSQFAKRQQRERLLRRGRQAREAICPGSRSACKVASSDSFECLDINSELESCGGCVNGYFNAQNITGTHGVDCTALPGIAFGSVTCASGVCEAYKCTTGYELRAGTCVAI